MTDSPIDLIEKYLERVKVYLPIGSEDMLQEIRTHLLEEAEVIGHGQITHGSAMLAIERFGDPKDAASAYAGTGRKIGPLPAEYTIPLMRLVLLLVVLATLFVVGASIIGAVLPDLLGGIDVPLSLVIVVVMAPIYALIIIGGLSYMDRGKAASEMTVIERILGIGSGAFKPKPLSDAVAELFISICLLLFLTSPIIQYVVASEWLPFIYPAVILLVGDMIKSLLFIIIGENNINLLLEAVLGASWVVLCMFLLNISFPLIGLPVFVNGHWSIASITDIMEMFSESISRNVMTLSFSLSWTIVIFIIVLSSLWEMLVASIKIPMYLNAGKGWWWRDRHEPRRWHRYRLARHSAGRPVQESGQPSNY